MKFRKSMFMLVLVIFLFSIAAAGASDADDRSLASDDTDQMELSSDNTIIEDNLKTSEEKTTLTTGHTVDGNDFDSIQNAIDDARPGDTIFLGGKNYTGNGKYITVDKEVTIIGGFSENDNKYATLDAKSLSRIMNITADNVVLKGIIFTNGKTQDGFTVGRGGAIYGDAFTFSAVNCTFNYNNAYNYGGAIYGDNSYAVNCIFNNNIGFICGAMEGGSAVNCIFNNNEAYNGGAVYGVSAVNCTFNNNHATASGGAICHGSAVNCIFNNNTAREGGAIYGDYADTCIFKTTSDTALDTTVLSPVLTVDNFNTVINSGKKLTFDLKTNNGNSVTNGNISISVYYKNGAWFGKYNCLSGEEWIPDLPVGSYYAIFDTEYAEFQPINRTINIIPNIPYYVNVTSLTTNNRTVNITAESNLPQDILDCKLLFILPNGTQIEATYAGNGTWWAVHRFADYGFYQVNALYEGLNNVTVNKEIIAVIPEHTFYFLNYTINGNDNPVIELSHDFYFDPAYDAAFVNGIVINRPVTIKGNGNAIDAKRQARIFYVQSANAVLENLTLKNANYNGDGGAIYFSSSATSGTVSNCNFTGNTASGDGGAIRMYSGTVSNCNFADNTANRYGGAVYFSGTGEVTNCNFTDNEAYYGGAVYFLDTGNVTNCNFTGNTASIYGGAIAMGSGTVSNCNFTNNKVTGTNSLGGAIRMSSGTVSNCNFVDNKATGDYSYGGAIWIYSGNVTNCNFTGNNATTGSAIYFYMESATNTVSNSRFLNNRANAEALEITKNDNNITITFTGRNNLLNAIYSRNDAEVTFTNVTYWGAKGITTVSSTMSGSNKAAGQNITVKGVVNGKIIDKINGTDENGEIVLDDTGDYWIIVSHKGDLYYTEIAETLFTNMKLYANVTSLTTNNKTVNITAKSNIYSEVMPGKLLFILSDGTADGMVIEANYAGNGTWWAEHTFDAYGEYKVNATYVGLDNVTVNNATITVNKIKTELSGNAITTTYNINKDLIITLKDSNGNPVSGAKLIVDLNGAKTYTTDKNGQIKVSTKGLAPKTYTAKVTFNGNTNYEKSAKNVKVTVKKATPKLTAKKKTFKTTTKTKKYIITLKDNTGKAIKKAKVTLKVKGKTYKATTNSKGKAVFKIKNLKKKGTFKATITYKGNKYYNKITKKANIKVIVTFKTVSKGSKDKSTVKEIQQALKDHGYYLSYKGHYLKVDGKFQSCTERSVKEFQHDKGLKVTGKVDEKTAKKLGLI